MEELLMNPSQRQIIPLQSRPYENDPVSGSLTVEVGSLTSRLHHIHEYPSLLLPPKQFLFIVGSEVPNAQSVGGSLATRPIREIEHFIVTFYTLLV